MTNKYFETKEQIELRNTLSNFADNFIPKFLVPENKNKIPRPLFEKMAELGLTGLRCSEDFGGINESNITHSIVIEEISKVSPGCAIFLSVHNMVSKLLEDFASNELKAKFIPQLITGKSLAAFALTEPQAGSDASSIKTKAELQGNNYVINGEKSYITSAGFADLYLIFAKTSSEKKENISAFIVPANSKGLTTSPPEEKMGAELSPIASLNLNNVTIPKENILGSQGAGYKIALSALTGGRISIAACALGISEACLKHSINYLTERSQFKTKLINFQALQFMLADMQIQIEASRLLTWQAARLVDDKAKKKQIRISASIAKCHSSDTAMNISTNAVQLHGGAGYIADYKVEGLMRAAKMLQIVEGTNQIQRVVIAKNFLK